MTDHHLIHKRQIHNLWQQINRADLATSTDLLRGVLSPCVDWNASHPINELQGADAVLDAYWTPLKRAMPGLRRDHYLLFAGTFNNKDWVTATGYYHGTFHENWLGLPVAGMPVRLRFGEFYATADGKITEVYLLFDLVDLLQQVGVNLLTSYGGEQGYVPGPLTGDGVILDEQATDVSALSYQLVHDMIYEGLSKYDQQSLESMDMKSYWKLNMLWYGPAGIGTTRGLKGFEDQHQRPFLESFPDRRGGHHKARFADGLYVASTGWPSVVGTHVRDYLGVPGTGKPFKMRVMDWWRAEDGLLYENWVLLDLPHTFLSVGHDIFAEIRF